jgi:hypothetical protein
LPRAAGACCALAQVWIVNYKKDGTPFRNLLHVNCMKDPNDRVVFYIAVSTFVQIDGVGTLSK